MINVGDNNLGDILSCQAGEIGAIDQFIDNPNFMIKNDKASMYENWDAQFLNTIAPDFATELLKRFYLQQLLSLASTAFLQ